VDWYTAGCCSCGHISGHPEQTLKHLFSVGFVLGFVVIGGLGVDVKPEDKIKNAKFTGKVENLQSM